MKISKCNNRKNHTKCPKTYIEWVSWADDMKNQEYKQYQCPECGRYEIWIKKEKVINHFNHSKGLARVKNNFYD